MLAAMLFRTVVCLGLVASAISTAEAASYAGYVMDAKTGKVLYEHRADARQYPASLTKMMTLYLLFEAIDSGKMSLKTRIQMSKNAASKPPSKVGIKAGGTISAEQAIGVLTTKSANDVATAVAEHLGGSESKFAEMMTRKARELGMSSTTFKNASGLPNSAQVTTARDMARLGIALREHYPEYYGYFGKTSYTYGKRRYGNHNRLLGKVNGMDGIKTGYTRASGYNLVSSVRVDGRSIVAVVLGGKSGKSRNAQMVKLIRDYLPKASRGEGKLLLAKRGSSKEAMIEAVSIELPSIGPLPQFKNSTDDPASQRVAAAHIISADNDSDQLESNGDFRVSAIARKLLQLGQSRLPVPSRAPSSGRHDAIQTAGIANENGAQALLSAYAADTPKVRREPIHKSGWQVQIGAVVGEETAIALLEKARDSAPKVLSGLENYTETVEKNGIVLHRARFAGLGSKDAARDTCKQLQAKDIDCLALMN
jgi:D-alanyl-D-alanine carboxypeptidase